MIPYGKQQIDRDDIDAITAVLQSDFLTQGPAVPRFEQALCEYVQADFAIAVNSATSALHIACQALDLGPGDWLWTSAITFVASANCGRYCGANIDFIDIDPETYNLCPRRLKSKLEKAKEANKLPKIVVAVHLSGQPCDLQAIAALATEYGFYLIEDAAHAIGSQYHQRPIGACAYSDITVFSFHPVKIITTGEGGIATTNNEVLAQKMQTLRSHGITRDTTKMKYQPDGPWYYEQLELGQHYRMTDIQAALGCSQLKKIDQFIQRRRQLAQRYLQLLADLPLSLPTSAIDESAWHLFIIRLHVQQLTKTHRQIFCELQEKDIGVNLHYIPVYKQPYYQQLGFAMDYCPKAEDYYREAISLPLFPGLSDSQQTTIVETLEEVLAE